MASVGHIVTAMSSIQASIGNVSGLAKQIGSATDEQAATAREISRRMAESAREIGHNAAATQEMSATVHEISRTAAELARISSGLAEAMARFQVH